MEICFELKTNERLYFSTSKTSIKLNAKMPPPTPSAYAQPAAQGGQ